jgi:aspergillopepsin I
MYVREGSWLTWVDVVCFGAIQSNGGADLQIYGDIFFKSQFVAFDSSGPSIGVAPHA